MDFDTQLFFHFSYCDGMEVFNKIFHKLWQDSFTYSALSTIRPTIGHRNCDSLQQKLVKKKPDKHLIKYNYDQVRKLFLEYFLFKSKEKKKKKKKEMDFDTQLFFHFSYCDGMEVFNKIFHKLWQDSFTYSALSTIRPTIGHRNCDSLQQKLVKKKPDKHLILLLG